MGWGTFFRAKLTVKRRLFAKFFLKSKVFVDAYLNRIICMNKQDVLDKISEREANITSYRETLLMIAMANPKDLAEPDEDVIYATKDRVNDLIDEILSDKDSLVLLQLYLEALNDGTAKFGTDA